VRDESKHLLEQAQRARVRAALAREAYERGYANTTISGIVRRARVSRRTFYALYGDRDACLVECLDGAIARARPDVAAAYGTQGPWADRIREALEAILALIDADPQLARLCLVDALSDGPEALARRHGVLEGLIAAVRDGGDGRSDVPAAVAAGIVAGALALVSARLLEPRRAPVRPLLGVLMSMIVLPYLGPARAREELESTGAAARARHAAAASARVPSDIRLTYRTLRVLAAIRAAPGASNSDVAAAAGIADGGQASKLLARLRRRGLIVNGSPSRAPHARNAWTLTRAGRELLGSAELDTLSGAAEGRAR
jgi:AcrR family transcriptional regulator/DNA-binding MarR family transcriptional regulator